MELKATTKITKINIALYVYFAVANLFELGVNVWDNFVFNQQINDWSAGLYLFVNDYLRYEQSTHQILNLVSLILLVVWFVQVFSLMRKISPGFKANKVMVYFFWLIPGDMLYYMYASNKKILNVDVKQDGATQFLKRLNTWIFVIFCCSLLLNLLWILFGILDRTSFNESNFFKTAISFYGLFGSILVLVFYRGYLKYERKLILKYQSIPELNETDLIDG